MAAHAHTGRAPNARTCGGPGRILKAVKKDQNIRQPSSDMAVGEKVLSAGDMVGPAEIGLLASVGAILPRVLPQVLCLRLPPLPPSLSLFPSLSLSLDLSSSFSLAPTPSGCPLAYTLAY